MPLGATTAAPACCLDNRRLSVELERGVVIDGAVRAHHTAVAVRRVLIQTKVGHDDEFVAEFIAQGAQSHLGDAVDVVRATAELVFL